MSFDSSTKETPTHTRTPEVGRAQTGGYGEPSVPENGQTESGTETPARDKPNHPIETTTTTILTTRTDQLRNRSESIDDSSAADPRPPKADEFGPPPESSVTRVYKKCASNGSLAVYVGTRTLGVQGTGLEPLKGVVVLDKESLSQSVSNNFRIWGQITLTFRYGREDEEVLGLKFCNEAILALKQLWPPLPTDLRTGCGGDDEEELTPLQAVLLERVKTSSTSDSIYAVPFSLSGGAVGLGSFPPPPSVLLVPAKPYKGSPIGTIYDLRIYAAERPEERPPRRNLIRLALRTVQAPNFDFPYELKRSIEARPTFLSRGKIRFQCELNKNAVRYGEPMEISINVQNNSKSSIRRILVTLIQQVDVCMFASGKFKNTVGMADDGVLIVPGASLQKRYVIPPTRGTARQWLALEEAFGREPVLAPSTSVEGLFGTLDVSPTTTSRNVFAIIVSYYVKAKLVIGSLSQCPSVKLSFGLLPPANTDPDHYPEVASPPPGPRSHISEHKTAITTTTTTVTTTAEQEEQQQHIDHILSTESSYS